MKTMYFVRHAEPNYKNHNDLERELTSKGLEDRQLVTAFLADKGVSALYASPYRRACDTVAPFAEAAELEIRIVQDFRERKVGEGWIEDFREYSERQWADFSYALPQGESLAQVEERNFRALEQVLAELPEGGSAAVGSHGTALSVIIHRFQPAFGCKEFYRLGKLPWIVKFVFASGQCQSIVSYDLFTGESEKLL